MKKIIALIAAVCMILSLTAIFASAADVNRCASLAAYKNCGYGIWDLKNDQIIVHIADDTNWSNIIDRRTFIGFCIGTSNGDRGGSGILDVTEVNDYYQYGGTVVAGSENANKKTFAFKVTPQSVSDIISGKDESYPAKYPDMIEKYGGTYCVRIDTTNTSSQYVGYCLPVFYKEQVGLQMTSATFDANGKIVVKFNFEVDNVWDFDNTDDSRNGSIYEGCGRYCAIRIVDKDLNLMWDGQTPAQWTAPIMDVWNWPRGFITSVPEYGALGCNSFADICALVDKGGKFEGCTVTYCVEEMIGSNGASTSAVPGDGYINSFFANGCYNDLTCTLKANKVAKDSLDGAYVTMYKGYNAKTADYTSVAVAGSILAFAAAAVVIAKKKH